jgi:hypothetical protein
MTSTIPITHLKPYERLSNGRLVVAVTVERDTVTVTLKGGKPIAYPADYEVDVRI